MSLNMVYMYLSYIVLYPFENDKKNNNTSLFTDPLFSLLRSWARIGKIKTVGDVFTAILRSLWTLNLP